MLEEPLEARVTGVGTSVTRRPAGTVRASARWRSTRLARFEHEIRRGCVPAQHVAPALASARKRGPVGRRMRAGAAIYPQPSSQQSRYPDKVEVFVIEVIGLAGTLPYT